VTKGRHASGTSPGAAGKPHPSLHRNRSSIERRYRDECRSDAVTISHILAHHARIIGALPYRS
jgi:hypothetical protein